MPGTLNVCIFEGKFPLLKINTANVNPLSHHLFRGPKESVLAGETRCATGMAHLALSHSFGMTFSLA